MFSCNRTYKVLNFRLTNNPVRCPFFRLHINQGEAEFVFHDNAINAVIAGSGSCVTPVSNSSVSHF